MVRKKNLLKLSDKQFDMSNTWNNYSSTGNKIVVVEGFKNLLDYWNFLLEGFLAVQSNCRENLPDLSVDQYFKNLTRVSSDANYGVILLLTSKNNKPLGFIVLTDVTEPYEDKVFNIFIAYSNGKCPSTIAELRYEGLEWAKKRGFKKARATSFRISPLPARISGAVRRYFAKTLGLRVRCVVFEAPIT